MMEEELKNMIKTDEIENDSSLDENLPNYIFFDKKKRSIESEYQDNIFSESMKKYLLENQFEFLENELRHYTLFYNQLSLYEKSIKKEINEINKERYNLQVEKESKVNNTTDMIEEYKSKIDKTKEKVEELRKEIEELTK